MNWRVLAIGAAGVLFLQGAGCENIDKVNAFFTVDAEPSAQNRVVNASLDQVSVKAQTTMSQLGYAATTTRQGDEIRINTTNSNGCKLTLILTPIKGKDGEQTRAHIEWENGRDVQTGMLILSKLEQGTK